MVRLLGAVDVLGEGRVTANFGGGAIAGAIVMCYGWGEGDDQLWGSGRRAIAGCHCRVPISVSYLPPILRTTNFTQTPKKNNNEFCLELLADVTLFSTLIIQNWFWLSGVYAGIICGVPDVYL